MEGWFKGRVLTTHFSTNLAARCL